MTRWFLLLVVLLVPICASAIVGDLNNDGTVNFSDFFILADNFGKSADADSPDIAGTNVTFSFDFSDNRYLLDWSLPSTGNWDVEDGWLVVRGAGEGTSTTLGPTLVFTGDIDVSVETDWKNNIGRYGLRFRIGPAGTAYLFDILPSTYFEVWKWDIDGIEDGMALAESATISKWGQNRLRVRTEGARLRFYINDTKVYEVTDYNFFDHEIAEGKVGLFVGGDVDVRFDNLIIRTSPNQIVGRSVVVHDTITVVQTTPEYATESRIDGDFNGWDGETIFRLVNGQIWQQSRYAYTYHFAYRPEVVIYRTSDGFKMQVDGVDGYVYVERTR